MLPTSTVDNIKNELRRDPEFFRNNILSYAVSKSLADGENGFSSELGSSYGLALCLTILFHLVGNVFGGGSSPEMRPVATKWIIPHRAVVTSMFAFWNWAMMQFVSKPMGGRANVVMTEQTVRASLDALPLPTFIRPAPINLRPKYLLGCSVDRVLTVTRDIAKMSALNSAALMVGFPADWGYLSATAYAQTGRIGRLWILVFERTMSCAKAIGSPSLCAQWLIVLARQIGFLSTSTLAFTIGRGQSVGCNPRCVVGYVFGKVWSMIHDVVSSLIASGRPGTLQRRPVFLLCFTRSIVPQVSV